MIVSGRNFVSSPPEFSNDGRKLLVCSGNTVSVFSTSTGMKITELEGHTLRVTSVVVLRDTSGSTKSLSHCWTSSLDETIRNWDFSRPELLKKVDVRFPIHSMVIPIVPNTLLGEDNDKRSNVYAFVSVEDMSKPDDHPKALRGQIRLCNLTKSRMVGGLLAETRRPQSIIIGTSQAFFGIPNKRKLHLWKIPTKDFNYHEVKKIKLYHTKNLTTLAFHPTERIVAGGDVTGRILIWRGFGRREFSNKKYNGQDFEIGDNRPGVRGNDDAESCTTWHWHTNEVNFLSFSSDGAYLYSGGKEGVLVAWQLDTGKRKVLPRIGSPLLYYRDSLDPSLSSISCADNKIFLLKMPSMEIFRSIAGIQLPCSFPEIYKDLYSGFVFDESAALVALRTGNYCIQFYSLFDGREVSQVRVCERNYQPAEDITVVVTLVALSIDCSKMSTVEVKLPEDGIGGLVTLKFWTSGSQSGEFNLSTVIYEPHSDAGISAIAYHPSHSMAVTSSYGGDFKIWIDTYDSEKKDQLLQKSGWKCQSVGAYKKRPMTAAAFSADGSVLAVAAETVATLWDPETNVLVAIVGETDTPIVSLSFIGKSEHLAAVSRGSKPQLSVWSMSKLSLSWAYNFVVEAISCVRDGSQFAVLALIPESLTCAKHKSDGIALQDEYGAIMIFNADDPVPVATWFVEKAKGGGIGFLPRYLSGTEMITTVERAYSSLLVYINGEHEYTIFDPYNSESQPTILNASGNNVSLEETGEIGYASIYGKLPEQGMEKVTVPAASFVPSDRTWKTIFSESSHAIPPLKTLCSAFLASLLEKRPIAQ